MEIAVALMTRAVMMLLVQCHYLGYDHLPGRPLQRTKFIPIRDSDMKDLQYSVYVYIITETGMVQTAECTCKAGQSGVCAHAGALLQSLVKIREACPLQSCQWKAPP